MGFTLPTKNSNDRKTNLWACLPIVVGFLFFFLIIISACLCSDIWSDGKKVEAKEKKQIHHLREDYDPDDRDKGGFGWGFGIKPNGKVGYGWGTGLINFY